MTQRRNDDDEVVSAFGRVMQERGRPHRVIPMPGMDGVEVAIWCPTEGERTAADVESRKHLTKTLGLSALDLTLAQETELARRERELSLLAFVLRDASDPEQAFVESVEELREHLGERQRKGLIAAVEEFERDRFSTNAPAENERVVQMVRDLKAAGALSSCWASFDTDTQLFIVHALAEACMRPTEESSSDTSPTTGPTTT